MSDGEAEQRQFVRRQALVRAAELPSRLYERLIRWTLFEEPRQWRVDLVRSSWPSEDGELHASAIASAETYAGLSNAIHSALPNFSAAGQSRLYWLFKGFGDAVDEASAGRPHMVIPNLRADADRIVAYLDGALNGLGTSLDEFIALLPPEPPQTPPDEPVFERETERAEHLVAEAMREVD